ncbi:MAG: DUF805 domain-containing protein [Pseudomonadota bacterium]
MYENSFTFTKMLAAYGKPHKFNGRSTRTELLGYLVISWLVGTAMNWVLVGSGMAGSIELGITSFRVAYFLVWIPFPALAVRRFHDQDKPGWWALLLVLPTVAFWLGFKEVLSPPARFAFDAIYLGALVLLFWKPTDGTNRYGPDPRVDPEDAALASE